MRIRYAPTSLILIVGGLVSIFLGLTFLTTTGCRNADGCGLSANDWFLLIGIALLGGGIAVGLAGLIRRVRGI